MGKFLKIIISLIIVLFIALMIVWNFLPTWVSSTLSDKMKVAVSISDIGLAPSQIKIDDLKVGNPKGSILSKALTVDDIAIQAPLKRYLDKDIVIDMITMDDVYLGLEFDSKGSTNGNWTTIMNNLQKDTSSGKESDKSVLIRRLVLTNINVDLVYRNEGSKVTKLKPIRRIELNDISSKGGMPTSQITNIVMREVLRNVFTLENLQNMLKDVISPDQPPQDLLKSLKDLFYLPPPHKNKDQLAA